MLLDHLRALVSFDTRNPPRRITGRDEIFVYLRDQLSGYALELTDHGDGCVSLLARRGRPRWLLNAHLDTVPQVPGWSSDPLTLVVDEARAVGLGACDIKGGAAAMLDAASAGEDVALLFTTDEEYGHSTCVRRFLADGPDWLASLNAVLVAEPTGCEAVCAHRGYARALKRFTARAGHSADPRGLEESAVHQLARWLTSAIQDARARDDEGAAGLHGLRFNCGILAGGEADNVIAGEASAEFSVRPPPGVDPEAVARQLGADEVPFVGPACPASDADAAAGRATVAAQSIGAKLAEPVSFWTEASLFTEAGLTAFVCGPGNLHQAHTADEWVALDALDAARDIYLRTMT